MGMSKPDFWVEIDREKVEVAAGQTLIDVLRERDDVGSRDADPVVMASINGRRTDLYDVTWKAADEDRDGS